MILRPYKRGPKIKPVGIFVSPHVAVDADGARIPKARWRSHRMYARRSDARDFFTRNTSSRLHYWNDHLNAWEASGGVRASLLDVEDHRAVFAWADWIVASGGAPGSPSGSARTLLQATIPHALYPRGDVPPLEALHGGREWGREAGRYGPGLHYDIAAAYLGVLGRLRYSGRWYATPNLRRVPDGAITFHAAEVTVTQGDVWDGGPIVTTPRELRPPGKPEQEPLRFAHGTHTGIWTGAELAAALEVGAQVSITQTWYCSTRSRPFLGFHNLIQAGRRELDGEAAALVKMTGNAAWGGFALHPLSIKKVRFHTPGGGTDTAEEAAQVPNPMLDLAEQLTGQVRARLYTDLIAETADCGELLLAYIDGGVLLRGACRGKDHRATLVGDWRIKDRSEWVEYLSPRWYRYWSIPKAKVVYKCAGIEAEHAPGAFEDLWRTTMPKRLWRDVA